MSLPSMLFLLIFSISPTLRRGDDPYSILGVTRDATAQQIRTAFRKIAFDHHPDRHKGDEESYRKWLRANDAYDILSDPQRKLRYDQDGTVSESDSGEDQQSQQQNTGGYYSYGSYGYRGSSTSSSSPSYHTPLMTEQLFPYLARDGNEWILFAFQHFDCSNCNEQQKLFEKFGYEIKDYVKVGRLDVTQAPNLADDLKITSVPQFLSVKLINRSKYEVHKLGSQFSSTTAAMNSLFKHWKASITRLSLKSSSLNDWISNKHQSKVHVIEVRIDSEKSETVHFKYAASKLRKSCVFASVTVKSENEARENWNISFKKLPVVLVFRSNDLRVKPIVIDSKGRRLLDEIDELSMPLFPTLSSSSIKRICNDWCVLHIDPEFGSETINSSFFESSYNMPFNTGRMKKNSKIASYFSVNSKSGSSEWIVVSLSKMNFWFVSLEKAHDFVTLCSNLYRADDVGEVMKNKRKFVISKIPFGADDVFDRFVSLVDDDESKIKLMCVSILTVLVIFVCYLCKSKPKPNKNIKRKEPVNKTNQKVEVEDTKVGKLHNDDSKETVSKAIEKADIKEDEQKEEEEDSNENQNNNGNEK